MRNKKFSILVVFLFISLCGGDVLTFYEHLIPQQIIAYPDNTVVFRLAERLNNTCNVPNLTFRVLYSNGTNNLVTVYDHQIPSFNFCISPLVRIRAQIIYDRVATKLTIPNYIFVIYSRITDENNIVRFGMLIDLNGK